MAARDGDISEVSYDSEADGRVVLGEKEQNVLNELSEKQRKEKDKDTDKDGLKKKSEGKFWTVAGQVD